MRPENCVHHYIKIHLSVKCVPMCINSGDAHFRDVGKLAMLLVPRCSSKTTADQITHHHAGIQAGSKCPTWRRGGWLAVRFEFMLSATHDAMDFQFKGHRYSQETQTCLCVCCAREKFWTNMITLSTAYLLAYRIGRGISVTGEHSIPIINQPLCHI